MAERPSLQTFESNAGGSQLRNRIFAVRHGESEANVAGLIVCDPSDGVDAYGLTEKGKQQAREVCENLRAILHPEHSLPEHAEEHCLPQKIIIVSSDFKRARETAEVLHTHLKVKTPIRFEAALRERNFGEFNLKKGSNYHKVWDMDAVDPTHSKYGNESVMDVILRTSRLVQSLDDEFQDHLILLVSHGDTLQILSALFSGVGPSKHRTLPDLDNCEVRELKYMS